ncbi:hypothetical protein EI94DRAFT_1741957, partial [Lactarius quietus]
MGRPTQIINLTLSIMIVQLWPAMLQTALSLLPEGLKHCHHTGHRNSARASTQVIGIRDNLDLRLRPLEHSHHGIGIEGFKRTTIKDTTKSCQVVVMNKDHIAMRWCTL